jgi:PilZ domain/SPOR domain
MDRHAYINIEPNNGGIVLNASEGGLCFHSFDPVPHNGTIRFWFSDQNQRIEAEAALAWTDETQKGGVRFTTLPEEARERIRGWISQPSASVSAEASAPTGPPPRLFPIPKDRRPDGMAAFASPAPLAAVPPQAKVAMPASGFSRGLATGLAVSVFVVALFLFQSYRREIGESLIQLGERFASKSQTEPLTASAAAPTLLPAPEVVSAAARPTVTPAPPVTSAPMQTVSVPHTAPLASDSKSEKVVVPQEKIASQPLPSPTKPVQAKLEPAGPVAAAPTAVSDSPSRAPITVSTPVASSKPPAISPPATVPTPTPAPTNAVASNSVPVVNKTASTPNPAATKQPDVQAESSRVVNPNSQSELYFDVGKFKTPSQAHDESDKLAQLGFPVTAVQKGFLWTNSFHVLVGPYADEERAKLTHENLVSSGFKPRAFERGSRDFTLVSPVTLGGARTPEGEYTIRWESYIGDASVKFMRDNSVIAEADGKWVKHDTKYPRDAYVYKRNPDGSHALLEIHFEGMRQALVF